ncbi:hypothetical protein EVAR_91806_1 [Eumeta japonica]|uniref:Uncharacterized protein n=1 Tax=Eumeta variegata TaxID=151549 RepID=A0A4C1T518_EUMVA|nr:hypothetical protein EVAR_91806_1 [Eumeta japonica]
MDFFDFNNSRDNYQSRRLFLQRNFTISSSVRMFVPPGAAFQETSPYRTLPEIRNIQIPQSGKYICVTESHIHTFEVIVQYRPVVLYRSPLVVRSKKGDPVELVVDYDAKPAAVVT